MSRDGSHFDFRKSVRTEFTSSPIANSGALNRTMRACAINGTDKLARGLPSASSILEAEGHFWPSQFGSRFASLCDILAISHQKIAKM
jgi:hypothetical protein